jgi:alanine dehydrogenase
MGRIGVGLARIHAEPGERRDFLPDFVAHLVRCGGRVCLEHGYGSAMGFTEGDYQAVAPEVLFCSENEIYQQDIVLVLRYPGDEKVRWMQAGASLVSMVHYPTRPKRVELLRSLGIEVISLDSVKDDVGRRIVENLRAVGWNGVEVAFRVLAQNYPAPGIEDAGRNPIKVTVLGAGAVGTFAIQAAVRYGNQATWQRMGDEGVTGVQVTVLEHDTTNHAGIMTQILKYTDVLVDATQRPDPSQPVIPNEWIGVMRPYAVLLDLSVDPYECSAAGVQMVKGIEGIPQGNLDQYIFAPDDPAYGLVPGCVDTRNRRWAASCYSWPGLYPRECMQVYGKQLEPLFQTVLEKGDVRALSLQGSFFERALARALLPRWVG